jgi:hypothetical protein
MQDNNDDSDDDNDNGSVDVCCGGKITSYREGGVRQGLKRCIHRAYGSVFLAASVAAWRAS